jgi:hypothetical protein
LLLSGEAVNDERQIGIHITLSKINFPSEVDLAEAAIAQTVSHWLPTLAAWV